MAIQYIKEKIGESLIRRHPNAASDPRSMKPVARYLVKHTSIKPQTVFEIGCNYAQDSAGIQYYLKLSPKNIWVFDAHPQILSEVKKLYAFKAYNIAAFNKEGRMKFNVVESSSNSGISSLYVHKYLEEKTRSINVRTMRMDKFLEKHKIKTVDFLKLDVEGANYEVLEGFGSRLKDVKSLHIEAEHEVIWEKQKLFTDIESLLLCNGFIMASFERHGSQSDSLWIGKEYLK